MVTCIGEMEIEYANEANIPVGIFIQQDGEKWTLNADNFMPRKGVASDGAYRYEAETVHELRELVKKHILPLYEVAVNAVRRIASGEQDKFYYWCAPKE